MIFFIDVKRREKDNLNFLLHQVTGRKRRILLVTGIRGCRLLKNLHENRHAIDSLKDMLISTTILYFNENPVGYEFYKTENGFKLRPAPSTKSNLIPPLITVVHEGNSWNIDGVQDEDICGQVLQLVENHQLLNLNNRLSAAM